jgi:hypothetical protein
MKISIFWNVTPCSPLKINWRLEGMANIILRSNSNHKLIISNPICRNNSNPYVAPSSGLKSNPSKALLADCFMLIFCLDYCSHLKMEATYSSETWLTTNGLYSVKSHRLEVFIPEYDFLLCVTHNTIRLGHSALDVKLMYTRNYTSEWQPNRTLLFLWQTGNCIPHSGTETAYQEGTRRTWTDNTNKKLTKWNEEMATDYFKPGGKRETGFCCCWVRWEGWDQGTWLERWTQH